LQIKKRNVVDDAGRINCSSFSNRTKEEAEGTAARRRRARFGGFDTQDGILGLVGGK
jgi:nicotinic acid phosphoribosyltransferase